MPLPIEDLSRLVAAKRGSRGVRAAASEAEISPATLSRIENGHMPDLATFAKLCKWLDRDPNEFLGFGTKGERQGHQAVVHFKKKKTVSMDTAKALGELIINVQRALQARNDLIGR